VVEGVIRSNATQFFNPAVLTEWSVGLGLLTFGAMREANRLAEELRENNLTIEVESVNDSQQGEGRQSRRIGLALLAGVLLIALLLALRWGSSTHGAATVLVLAMAIGALGGLFRVITRIR